MAKMEARECPIDGQVFQECKTCPATCDNPLIECPAVCRPGCECPFGQVIDTTNNRCVHPNACPTSKQQCTAYLCYYDYHPLLQLHLEPECPIEGQEFQECKTCPATCDNPVIPCLLYTSDAADE